MLELKFFVTSFECFGVCRFAAAANAEHGETATMRTIGIGSPGRMLVEHQPVRIDPYARPAVPGELFLFL
jgi:hypothetical protein